MKNETQGTMRWATSEEVRALREKYRPGCRIRLMKMDDIQAPTARACGTVRYVDDAGHIHVEWDTGSSLSVIPGADEFEIAETEEEGDMGMAMTE